jgi:hypothetical protein
MSDVPAAIVSGIFGLGWFTTAAALLRDRSAAKQEIMNFLMQKRHDLDEQPALLAVVGLLKQELEAKRGNKAEPTIPSGLDGMKLRELPAFLEPIGTYLEYNPATFRKAYGFFSEEVLLCSESNLLWKDDVRYDKSVYWRSFTKLVKATKKAGYEL